MNNAAFHLRVREMAAGLLLLFSLSLSARAATTFTVANNADSGGGSLRATIAGAGNGDTIVFAPAVAGQTITLSTVGDTSFGPSALAVTNTLTIDGAAAPGLIVSGGNALRLFVVTGAGNLTLKNITLANGKATGGNGGNSQGDASGGGGAAGLGGAIFNAGSLTVLNCTLAGNTAAGGNGGNGPIDVLGFGAGGGGGGLGGNGGGGFANSSPAGSHGGGGGGTQGAGGAGSATMGGAGGTGGAGGAAGGGAQGGTATGAGGGGGGPSFSGAGGLGGLGGGGGGSASFATSTGAGGFGAGGGGGGVGVSGGAGGFGGGGGGGAGGGAGFGGGNGAVGFANSGGGGGAGLGGAIFSFGGTLVITNCTISGNSAIGGAAGVGGSGNGTAGRGFGGALFNLNGTGTLVNVTLGSNTAKDGANANDQGGAIFNLADTALQTASITLQNSVAAGSTASNDIQNTQAAGSAMLTASAPNVVQLAIGNSAGTVNTSGVIVGDPALAALASNGGPTQTQAILTSSIAANAGNNALATSAGLTTDQRGFGRVAGTAVDLGAFEIQVPPTVSSISPPSGSPAGGTSVTITGANFHSVSGVTIGGVAATAVVVVSPTSITCTTPAHASGVVDVVVTTAFGTGTGTGLFTYATNVPPNVPPVITSPLSATPNPTVVGSTVTFTVSASDPENGALTTTFDYGDGSSGASTTHVYTTSGSFTAVAAISDGVNSVTSSTTVTVASADLNNDGQTTPMDVDTDGDGFPDNIEIAYGSSATSASSTPTGAAAKPFIKFSMKRVIVHGAPDRIDLRGILHVPAKLRLAGQRVVVDAGGNATAFTLNASGSATAGDSFLRIGSNAASNRDREARFTLKLKGTLLANLLLNAPHDTQGRATVLSVNILFNGELLNATTNLTYRSNGVAISKR